MPAGWALTLVTLCGPMLVAAVVGLGRWLAKQFAAVNEKLDEQGAELTRVKEDVTPNHGSSLRDAVDRVESTVSKIEGSYREHLAQSARDIARLDGEIAALRNH